MSIPVNPPRKQSQDLSNFITRAVTGLIGGPLLLFITYVGGTPFLITGLLLAILSVLEFNALGRQRQVAGYNLIGLPAVLGLVLLFVNHEYAWCLLLLAAAVVLTALLEWQRGVAEGRQGRILMTIAGLLYAGLPTAFLIELRNLPEGLLWIYLIFILTWSTDSFAYIGGRLWGKRKLAPRISPKKTIEGALVGVVGGFGLGLLLLLSANLFIITLLPLLILAPPLSVAGDLFESWLKRQFHVGDSHLNGLDIIPGHGGVLDRTDSLTWVVTLFYLLVVVFKAGF